MPLSTAAPRARSCWPICRSKQRAEFFKTVTLKSYTPYTITDPQQLAAAAGADPRAEGYAVESGELQIGPKSVAAPVFDPDGQCEYAISAVTIARSGMAGDNFQRQKLQEVVIRTAEEITCELRHPQCPRHMNRKQPWRLPGPLQVRQASRCFFVTSKGHKFRGKAAKFTCQFPGSGVYC